MSATRWTSCRDAFDQIAKELRSQYNIGYMPTNRNKDGTFRKVEIRSKGGYKIQSRSGLLRYVALGVKIRSKSNQGAARAAFGKGWG